MSIRWLLLVFFSLSNQNFARTTLRKLRPIETVTEFEMEVIVDVVQ